MPRPRDYYDCLVDPEEQALENMFRFNRAAYYRAMEEKRELEYQEELKREEKRQELMEAEEERDG